LTDTTKQSFDQTSFSVELATDADHTDICRLYEAGVQEGNVHDNDTGADIDHIQAGYFNDEGASSFWVARKENRVIGMIGVQRTDLNSAEIRRLRVDHQFRRRGVGAQLMETALEFCRAKGYLKIVLDVRFDRGPAIALFEKFGFSLGRTQEVKDRELIVFYLDLYSEPGS